MIIADTNVLSEALKPAPSETVMRWLATQDPATVFTTTISQAELLCGVEALPHSKRRTLLASAIERMLEVEFRGRILPFDQDAAHEFARIVTSRAAAGRPISQFDGMIAAIARSRGGEIATRNTPDFERCGIQVINPWLE